MTSHEDFESLKLIDPARDVARCSCAGLRVDALERPVIISDVLEGWRARERWSSRHALESHYGDMPLRVWRTKCYSGSLFSRKRNLARRMPLADYLRKQDALSEQDACLEGAPYVFEDEFSGPRADLLDDFHVPECFLPDVFDQVPALRKTMPQFRWFLCGLRGSGSAIHVDPKGTAAWNALLTGTKRWWFFPPSESPPLLQAIGVASQIPGIEPETPLQWWRQRAKADNGGKLAEFGMLEALQLPGETVFVPQGWWHQVLNLDFTVSATQNFILPSMLPTAFQEWKRAWPLLLTVYQHATKPADAQWPEPDDDHEHVSRRLEA